MTLPLFGGRTVNKRCKTFFLALLLFLGLLFYITFINNNHQLLVKPYPLLHFSTSPDYTLHPSNINGVDAVFSAMNTSNLKRVKNMARLEAETGININYFEAITPLQPVFEHTVNKFNWTHMNINGTNNAHFGCFFSHLAFWNEISN